MEKKKTGPLSSSLAKLSGSSRGIPSDKDFHFYNNFDEFKHPIREIADKARSMLETIGQSSAHLWGKEMVLTEDYDDAYEWLVNVNDEVFERFDYSADEFQKLRKCEDENGFQMVYGKKKGVSQVVDSKDAANSSLSEVKVAYKDKKSLGTKPKVPFHIPTIRRPQDEYKILVNNSNQPFEHVWLQRSEDGSRFIHPLEKFSAMDFVDKNISDIEPIKPPPVECTPYKLVEEVKDLKELAAKLRGVNEFAVDLEHNQYRSYQGLTCLMQISTRADDFVVDTLKLHVHIGPHLREVFKDPTKKKVMHGADRDIIWLERDFGIYVCNLFDTGQASRVLKLERNSLEYLLHHFCGVAANKEYQNADWRLRPLTDVMLRYAREDTHYLLHIYDLMRIRLFSFSTESENSENSIVEVYQRSYDICMQLYKKEVLTDSSYLHIYGIQSADLNAQQLAIVANVSLKGNNIHFRVAGSNRIVGVKITYNKRVSAAGLCEWRDVVARAEDESTGYILPNKILLEIAKQMPLTTSKLRRLVKSKNQYIDRNLGSVVNIIRHSMQNSAAYESIAKQLKEERRKATSDGNLVVADGSEASSHPDVLARSKAARGAELVGSNGKNDNLFKHLPASVQLKKKGLELENSTNKGGRNQHEGSSEHPGDDQNSKNDKDGYVPALPRESLTMPEQVSGAEATVQVLKKPNRAFGALLGTSAAKRKFDPERKEKEEVKLEQIKSSVNLPFHSFLGKVDKLQPVIKEPAKHLEILRHEEHVSVLATKSHLQDIIILLDDDSDEEAVNDDPKSTDDKIEQNEGSTPVGELATESHLQDIILLDDDSDEEPVNDDPMSADEKSEHNEASRSASNQQIKWEMPNKSRSPENLVQFKPFDYEAARKQVSFGDNRGRNTGEEVDESGRSRHNTGNRKKSSAVGQPEVGEESGGFQLGRRRQAFPATGNRSATFR